MPNDAHIPLTFRETIALRLYRLVEDIRWWGVTVCMNVCGKGRDEGPKSPIDYEKVFRVERAITRAKALMDVFAGRLTFAPPPECSTIRPATVGGTGARGPRGNNRKYYPLGCTAREIRDLFSTRSIREIATRICIDLDILYSADNWPTELFTLHQTPAEWSAAQYPPDPPPDAAPLIQWHSPTLEAISTTPLDKPSQPELDPPWRPQPSIDVRGQSP